MLDKLIPNFLKRADQFLLKNHPLIWRTKIHFVVFYSLVLGNVGAIGLGLLYPIDVLDLPPGDTFDLLLIASSTLAGFAMIFWGYSQYKMKLQSRKFRVYLLTGLLYFAGTVSIWFNVLNFNTAVKYKIANLVDDAQLERDEKITSGFSGELALVNRMDLVYARYNIPKKIEVLKPIEQWIVKRNRLKKIFPVIQCAKIQVKQYPNFVGRPHRYHSRRMGPILEFYYMALLGFMALPMTLLLLSKIKFSDLLLTIFFQVILFIGALMSMEWFGTELPTFYFWQLLVLMLAALLTFRNRRRSIYIYTLIASTVPIGLFIVNISSGYYYPAQMHFTKMVMLGLTSSACASIVLFFLNRLTLKPA